MNGDRAGELVELIDDRTVACLGDGWHAAMCIDAKGQAWPWLLTPARSCAGHTTGCRFACCAPHEQTGPLPVRIRARINRCRHTRGTWRCSRAIPLDADHCWQHSTGGRP